MCRKTTRSGRLWSVTCFWNPLGWKSRKRNYKIFRDALDCPLLLVLGDDGSGSAASFVEGKDAEIILRVPIQSCLWHKESLLNLGIAKLPAEAEFVVWLDADVVFTNEHWIEQTCERLEKVAIVQPFSECVRLSRDAALQDGLCAELPDGNREMKRQDGFYASLLKNPQQFSNSKKYPGHPGFAMAARRDFLAAVPLYEMMVFGGGDRMFAYGPTPFFPDIHYYRHVPLLLAHYASWKERCRKVSEERFAATPGRVLHLWHGDQRRRHYTTRWGLYPQDFDPERHLVRDAHGLLCWNHPQPIEQPWERLQRYRQEDG